jgi:hypothetical protein
METSIAACLLTGAGVYAFAGLALPASTAEGRAWAAADLLAAKGTSSTAKV